MAVPTLKLDLAPPSTLWRLNHALIGWGALVLGAGLLLSTLGLTLKAYRDASLSGKRTVLTNTKSRMVEDSTQKVVDELRAVDVAKELPRWRLAERIYTERSLPWSRLTAELERSFVQDVRLKSLQRTRGSDMKVQLKLKGEALSREAEAFFMETLQKNPFFEQVILEREGERQGGGVDFEYTLAACSIPPPYAPLPKFGPKPLVPKAGAAPPPRPAPVAAPRPPMPPAARPQVHAPAAPPVSPMQGQPAPSRTPRPPRTRAGHPGGQE
jgi:hypothetical protein